MDQSTSPCRCTNRRGRHAHRLALLWSSLVLSLGMTACGGGGGGDATSEAGANIAVWPLLDDEGLAMPSTSVPADPNARTRARLYANVEQAGMLVAALGPSVVQVEVGCCGTDAVSLAVMRAAVAQAARPTTALMPVLVSGDDLGLAALVADRLAEERMLVFLVTP